MNIKFLLIVSLLLLCTGLLTNTFSQQSNAKLKHLAKEADIIVTGKISKQKSNWNTNKTRIYTQATLNVNEYLKGNNKGNSVTVTYPGGEVGGIGELYTHMPRFKNEEEVLVFLKKENNGNSYKVFDGENGEIKILKDAKTGKEITSSNIRIEYLKTQIKSYLKK
jgi:uncharacterized membrane protein